MPPLVRARWAITTERQRVIPPMDPFYGTNPDPTPLAGRVLLSEGMQKGIDPPAVLEPGVLLQGKVHIIYAAAGKGKTMLALWVIKNAIERRENVILFDRENGARTISERLVDLGLDPDTVDEHLYYYPDPNLPLTQAAKRAYEALLDTVKPSLIIFDSFINFLAMAGLSENENTDVAKWATFYAHPARSRDVTAVILDHVPHDGSHARGATRKKDEVDVMWRLAQAKPFDRETVGEITLVREKDREGWLPHTVTFSVGGSEEGITFRRSHGTLETASAEDGLTNAQRRCWTTLRMMGEEGIGFNAWVNAANVSKGTLSPTAKLLVDMDMAYQDREGKYHPKEQRFNEFNGGSLDHLEPGGTGSMGSVSLKTEPIEPPTQPNGEVGAIRSTTDSDKRHSPSQTNCASQEAREDRAFAGRDSAKTTTQVRVSEDDELRRTGIIQSERQVFELAREFFGPEKTGSKA
jgi:hypothetical protein